MSKIIEEYEGYVEITPTSEDVSFGTIGVVVRVERGEDPIAKVMKEFKSINELSIEGGSLDLVETRAIGGTYNVNS